MRFSKPKKIPGSKIATILREVCANRAPVKVAGSLVSYATVFLDIDEQHLTLENNLSHLDDVHRMRKTALELFFPYGNAFIRGSFDFVGLSTVKNIRGLKFSIPLQLMRDEKRNVRRIRTIPREASMTFNTVSLDLFDARIVDVSSGGVGFAIKNRAAVTEGRLKLKGRIHVDMTLTPDLRLSFDAEVRHVTALSQSSLPETYQIGAQMKNLGREAQQQLNHWLFKTSARDPETDAAVPVSQAPSLLMGGSDRNPRGILAVGPSQDDLDFLYQCLYRKYDVMTSDTNIANIRSALSAKPSLLMIFLDHRNASKAAFTRKFCATLSKHVEILFYGYLNDSDKLSALTGKIRNLGYLDISDKRVLSCFQAVNKVMTGLST